MNVWPQGIKWTRNNEQWTYNEHLKLEITAKYAEHCQAKYGKHGRVSVMKMNIVSVHLSCILKKATMEFTTTERGSRKLIKDGYMYLFKKRLANDNSTWECEWLRNCECRPYTKLNVFEDFIEQRNEHSHPPSQTKCNTAKTKVDLKRKATEIMDTTRQILYTGLGNVSEAAAVWLLSNEKKRSIRNQRQDRNQHPNPVVTAAIP